MTLSVSTSGIWKKKDAIFFNKIKGCFRQSKLQNFLHLPTMVADKIFRHIPTDCLEFEMTAEKWNYLITMTAGIQNVVSSAGIVVL